MADQTFTDTNTTKNPSGSSSHGFQKVANAASSVTDQARSAARDLSDKAMEMAGTSTEALKDHASEFVGVAKDTASQATDKLKETVESQKNAGAEYVGGLADTMRRAAREFDGDLPIAGTYIRKAASQVESVSDSIKNGNFNDLLRSAQTFARRQPTAFLGMAVLAGFGAVRFLKSSGETSGGRGSGETSSHRMSGNRTSSDHASRMNQPTGHAMNEGYRDGFTK